MKSTELECVFGPGNGCNENIHANHAEALCRGSRKRESVLICPHDKPKRLAVYDMQGTFAADKRLDSFVAAYWWRLKYTLPEFAFANSSLIRNLKPKLAGTGQEHR